MNTPEVFNTGFTGEMHPEWMAGPFKLDQYDSAAKTVTLAPNDKWWGEKPVLDKVIFRQLETSAQIAAFKNGEIDGVSANTISLYKQLEGTKNSEVRRGQRLFAGGLNLNAQKAPMTDVAIRKAIFTAVDREALRNVRFNGLNWEEPSSGSMMLLPFSKYYQDNYPVKETGADAAKKVLTDAGYAPNAAGIMEKDGVPAAFKISNFGDDPTTLAFTQTLQKQLQAGGMDVGIDQRASADFGKVLGGRDFFLSVSGYTVGAGRDRRRQAVLRLQDQRKRPGRRRTGCRRSSELSIHRGQRRAQQGGHGRREEAHGEVLLHGRGDERPADLLRPHRPGQLRPVPVQEPVPGSGLDHHRLGKEVTSPAEPVRGPVLPPVGGAGLRCPTRTLPHLPQGFVRPSLTFRGFSPDASSPGAGASCKQLQDVREGGPEDCRTCGRVRSGVGPGGSV